MEKSISLYEMTNDLINLIELEEVDEVVKAEIIEQMKLAIETKADNIVKVVVNYNTTIEAIKAEEKRLSEYRKVKENELNRLKEYTKQCLEMMDLKKIDTGIGKISLRKAPQSLEIVDEDLIPAEYKEIIQTIKIDKMQIKKDLKDKKIEGVRLVEGGNSLIIK